MCGRGDQVSIFKGRGDSFASHQTADVGHVSKHVCLNVSTELKVRGVERG